jgi:hypothetical protein
MTPGTISMNTNNKTFNLNFNLNVNEQKQTETEQVPILKKNIKSFNLENQKKDDSDVYGINVL